MTSRPLPWVDLNKPQGRLRALPLLRNGCIMRTPEKKLGAMANFLLPSLKLRERKLHKEVENFLLEEFDGFTVTSGMISGYWKDAEGNPTYGEHNEYKVAIREKAETLKSYLARLAFELDEECIYLEVGRESSFIYAHPGPK